MTSPKRPRPRLDGENRAFWTGGAEGRLMIAFCDDCARAIHPPQLVCPECWSEKVESRAVPGTGTVSIDFVSRTRSIEPPSVSTSAQ